MNFEFSKEQYALRDLARDVFEKESSPQRLRSLQSGEPRDRRVWKLLAELGLLEIANEIDLALVLEEAGRAALPEPLLETIAIAAPTIAESGSHPELLRRIASGDAIVSVLLSMNEYAVDADEAEVLLLERDGALHALEASSFSASRVVTSDPTRRMFSIAARCSDDTRIDADATRAFDRAAFATACVLNGISMRLLEMTTEYVKERSQFGRPVGSFQAVKHKLASVHVELEAARSAAWYAACAIASDQPDRSVAASIAKALSTTTATNANTQALQCHGGIGFTWEHDLHLWLKRGKALEQSYGNATFHHLRITGQVFEDA
ncbi:MAG: acyl-CoA dehydrogenase family protein [Actinomycetota bacterium]